MSEEIKCADESCPHGQQQSQSAVHVQECSFSGHYLRASKLDIYRIATRLFQETAPNLEASTCTHLVVHEDIAKVDESERLLRSNSKPGWHRRQHEGRAAE